MTAADLTTVTEAGIRLQVEAVAEGRGPGSRQEGVFYNPAMARNRDLSTLAAVAAAEPGWRILDGLAATGIRGLRLGAALPEAEVTCNDRDPQAAERIRAGAEANDVDLQVTCRNLGALLWEERFHLVDVDPFGSPAPLLDAAARGVRDGGIVAVTATDTTALHGRHAKPCRRRYGAWPAQTPYGHELALRILAAGLVRAGARRDEALTPCLSFADDHAYRLLARVDEAARPADAALDELAWVGHCAECGARGFHDHPTGACPCGADRTWAGPLWSGELQDPDLLAGMAEVAEAVPLARPDEARDLLAALREEAGAPALFFDLHEVASRAGVGAAPREDVLEALRERGYAATRTHHSPQGVRTDAPADVLAEVVREEGD